MDDRRALRELAPRVPDEDPAARERARARLEALIRSEGVPTPTRGRTGSFPRLVAAAVTVAAVLAVLFLQAVMTRPAPAAGALQDLATSALAQPGPELGPGDYAYTRSTGTVRRTDEALSSGRSWSYTVRVRRETWLALDGSGFVLEHYRHPVFVGPADRAAWRAAGRPDPNLAPLRVPLGAGGLATRPLDAANGDPAVLASMIESHAHRFRAGSLEGDLGVTAELLGESPASPELRAALLRLMARLDLDWDARVVDARGRSGVGVTLAAGSERITLVFDPSTSALLSYELRSGGGGGSVTTSYTFLRRAVVGSVRVRP